jgi:hypothetical protein
VSAAASPSGRGRAPAHLPRWLRFGEIARSPGGGLRLAEGAVLVLAGALLATATVNDLVRQTHTNDRLNADLRTWRSYAHHDYHNVQISRDVTGLTTREIACGNTSPGGPKERTQLCLLITGPVRGGRRSVSGGWYLPPKAEDEHRYRYGCFGGARGEERCPR